MKVFESDLILTKNTVFDSSITVKGNIVCKDGLWNIKALDIKAYDIKAYDIKAYDINANNINALDIKANNINAYDIKANNINALDIICEARILKCKTSKTICRIFIDNKSKLPTKEQILKKEEKI